MSLLGGLAQDNRSPKRIIWIGSNPFASVTVYVLTACCEHFCQDHAHLQGRIWPNLREFKPETSIRILIKRIGGHYGLQDNGVRLHWLKTHWVTTRLPGCWRRARHWPSYQEKSSPLLISFVYQAATGARGQEGGRF